MSAGIERNLTTILALCNNAHWTADRRWRIAELAQASLEDIKTYKQMSPKIAQLDDEVEPGCTDD